MTRNEVYVVMETVIETDGTDINHSDADTNLYGLYYTLGGALEAVKTTIRALMDKPYYIDGVLATNKCCEVSCDGDITIWCANCENISIRRIYDIDSREIK